MNALTKLIAFVLLMVGMAGAQERAPYIRPWVGFRTGFFQQKTFYSPTFIGSAGVQARFKRFTINQSVIVQTPNTKKTGDGYGLTFVSAGAFSVTKKIAVGGGAAYNTFYATGLKGHSWHPIVLANYSFDKSNRLQVMRHLGAANRQTLDRWDFSYEHNLNKRFVLQSGFSVYQYKVNPKAPRQFGFEEQVGVKMNF